jgi:hypothetical protein
MREKCEEEIRTSISPLGIPTKKEEKGEGRKNR